MSRTTRFAIGDHIVAPGCGVGTVAAIVELDVGAPVEAYKLEGLHTEVVMWVPVDRAADEGVRAPVKPERVDKLLRIIKETTAPAKRATWNRRQRRYREEIATNEPERLAAVLGELADVRQNKPLSFGERRLFDQVHSLLANEFSLVADAGDRLEEALAA
jgi:CarD family transcriptional regulator